VPEYLPNFRDWETYAAAGVIHLVAKTYPAIFSSLDTFCAQYQAYLMTRSVASTERFSSTLPT
jgi:hypothetical protein